MRAILAAALLGLPAAPAPAQSVTEVRTGIREIFGDAAAARTRLGILEASTLPPETKTLLDIIRTDLTLEGSLDIMELTPSDLANFQDPRLEIETVAAKGGVLVRLKVLAQNQTLLDKNLSESSNLRRLGHRSAQEILRTLTGAPGFFLSRIAFTLLHKRKKEIWIADWDGKNAARITNWGSTSLLPSFSRDGKKLAFTSYKDGNPDLFIYDLTQNSFGSLSTQQGLNMSAAFDPLGEGLVATLSKGKDPNLYFLSPSGDILRQLTRTSGIDTAATFSPNGQEIAFTTDRSGNPQIFLMSRDATNMRRLTYGFFWSDQAEWSRDGSAIAFSSKRVREEPFQIFVADPLGLHFVQMTNEGANESPSFSPDSKFLAYSSKRNGRWQIFIQGVTRATAEIQVLSFAGADCVEPAWSVNE